MESVSRSPIYSHFQESITGASTIRAYRHQDRFIQASENKVDYNQVAYYPGICANRLSFTCVCVCVCWFVSLNQCTYQFVPYLIYV